MVLIFKTVCSRVFVCEPENNGNAGTSKSVCLWNGNLNWHNLVTIWAWRTISVGLDLESLPSL